MKKQMLSLALLYAIPVMPSVAQPPVVEPIPAPDEAVQDAVASVEFNELLPELTKIEEELSWPISHQDRAEVLAALGYLLARGQLNKHNFKEKADLIIAQMIAQRSFILSDKHVHNRSGIHIANSMGRNAKAALDKGRSRSSVLSEYSGWSLQSKVTAAAHNQIYLHDRRCNGFDY